MGSGMEVVLLPGFAINWLQNWVTRQLHLHDLTPVAFYNSRPPKQAKTLVVTASNHHFYTEPLEQKDQFKKYMKNKAVY